MTNKQILADIKSNIASSGYRPTRAMIAAAYWAYRPAALGPRFPVDQSDHEREVNYAVGCMFRQKNAENF